MIAAISSGQVRVPTQFDKSFRTQNEAPITPHSGHRGKPIYLKVIGSPIICS